MTGFRVALLQTDPVLGMVEHNVAELHAGLRRVPDVDLAVAAELAVHGYHIDSNPLSAKELVDLGEHGPAVVVGFAEASEGGQPYNSAAVIDRTDVVVQRKLYLVQYRGWRERDQFRPGDRLDCHEVRGAKIAVLVCNDLWQPALPWLAAHSGAEVLVVIANSMHSDASPPAQRVWDVLITHAAVALQSYVVFVNRCGTELGQSFWGGSRVVGPDGEVIAELGAEPGIAVAEIDLEGLRELRREWPLLRDSGFDLIATETARRVTVVG
ncbi:amidohydrolase [Allokutzneria sp. A3M-2-11 16]|uniref:carbon-nitrogen hydrolase family protein n=1 Tax=Allokutzneria sp. A3M-2-11 16 TaxID=2962043 RepID=UPI0020B64F42|nr:nitrilase-related carbon-nitrogen hydrolase [Allokutzneria sp. A3M-2-11 16]MCP3803658.1 amidohydrolase [Allokutzneria sp. A3M-2-11 16]